MTGGLTTLNPTQLGLTSELIARVKAECAQVAAANRARLTAKYGTLSDRDIVRIVDAEAALCECAKCKGAPCERG